MAGGRAWGSVSAFLKGSMPHVGMTALQIGYAGMNIISVVSFKQGLSNYTLVVYRHAVAALVMAPFAIVLERKGRPKITFSIFLQMFVLGLLGPVIDQNLYYLGMKYTTTTFTSAMCNVTPAMAFVMALLCRMEIVNIKKVRSQAKVVGTLVTVAGAMVMTLYKGPILDMVWSSSHHASGSSSSTEYVGTEFVKGSIMIIISCLAWAALFVLQAYTLTRYPAQLTLTTMICFIGTLQGAVVALVMERHSPSSVWALGWDNKLLTVVYSGVVCSGVSYYVQGLVMEQRGPVFATAFSPLSMVFQVIMSSPIIHEPIYMGEIIGGVVIIVGLYFVLWGKSMDHILMLPADPEAAAGVGEKADKLTNGDGFSIEVASMEALPECSCRPEIASSRT
ncbi:WAT1-related protein At5g07050-like [Nymphaea colorata]|uniref:WAT1-related protein At5g07050-like n=1 Tax=Nymphaea colorata TaxID=210225 RepID=UPI00129E0D72|nr:WAT1-related protein At5g07050-like [Nymphaea colorata]